VDSTELPKAGESWGPSKSEAWMLRETAVGVGVVIVTSEVTIDLGGR
jgi:hypothetical protein